MTNAREIIARHLCTMTAQGWSGISPFERAAYRTTAAGMVEAITAAGFRIVGPDDLDEKTVERCAAELEKPHKFIDGTEMALPSALACAAAIRAMKETQG